MRRRAWRCRASNSWLAGAAGAGTLGGDERSLSAPHELALAQSLGWPLVDGLLPWALRAARADGVPIGRQRARPADAGAPAPGHRASHDDRPRCAGPRCRRRARAVRRAAAAVRRRRLRAALGCAAALVCRAREPGRPGDRLARPRDRAQRRSLAAGRPPRRARGSACSARSRCCCTPTRSTSGAKRAGLDPVNSFWLSGCGAHRPMPRAARRWCDDRLRTPALREDWAAWAEAWHALDAGPIAALLGASRRRHAHAVRRAARAAVRPPQRVALAAPARGLAAAGGAPAARRLVTQSTP